MATVKKSLTVNELADKIRMLTPKKTKDSPQGPTSKQMMAELRKYFTFSKDKWNAARKLITAVKAAEPVKPTKKPPEVMATIECICDDCRTSAAEDFFDMVEFAQDEAKGFVGDFYASLKAKSLKNPMSILIPDACPSARPEVFRLLDLAVESGLLVKHIGYSLSETAIKAYEKQRKDAAKKKANKK